MVHALRYNARVIQVVRVGNVENLVQFGLADVDFVDSSGSDGAAIEQVCALKLFVCCEKEKLVLDDRTTDVDAITLFAVADGTNGVTLEAVATHVVVCVVVEA